MLKSCRITVQGRVQGVAFRFSTLNKAVELGLKGNVKNLPSGSVYIEAEGEESELEQFILWCRSGPPAAKVEQFELTYVEPRNFSSFEILS